MQTLTGVCGLVVASSHFAPNLPFLVVALLIMGAPGLIALALLLVLCQP